MADITIEDIRQKFPMYGDMSDLELARALHDKYYSDIDRAAFAEKLGLKPDKYTQAAAEEDKAIGGGDAGLTRRLVHGATLGADTTVLAGLETPFEMVKRGTLSPGEAYNYAKAREDYLMNQARQNT